MSLEEFGEKVWHNWRKGIGPCGKGRTSACEDCPNRDDDGDYTPKNIDPGPFSGDSDPTVVYLGDCPGDGNDRNKKNSGNTGPVASTLSEEIERNWKPIMEDFEEANNELRNFYSKTDYPPEPNGGGFHTNIKKCADIENVEEESADIEDAKEANRIARKNCEEYLREQLKLLDPKVIVAFGNNTVYRLSEIYGFDRKTDNAPEGGVNSEALQIIYDDQSPTVIPSIHWSNLFLNYSDVPTISDKDEYWEQLASIVDFLASDQHPFYELPPGDIQERIEPLEREEFIEKFSESE